MKWARKKYKEVITVFYQALKKPQNNHTKHGEHKQVKTNYTWMVKSQQMLDETD